MDVPADEFLALAEQQEQLGRPKKKTALVEPSSPAEEENEDEVMNARRTLWT